jgi:hypothetical protein
MKTQDYFIKFEYQYPANRVIRPSETCFVIKAADVDMAKAQKIAEILFPQFVDIKVVSITNDENTLTYRDYEVLKSMVNDKLIACIRGSRIPYDELKHPLDVMYKTLLEKMTARIHQFQHPFCC